MCLEKSPNLCCPVGGDRCHSVYLCVYVCNDQKQQVLSFLSFRLIVILCEFLQFLLTSVQVFSSFLGLKCIVFLPFGLLDTQKYVLVLVP